MTRRRVTPKPGDALGRQLARRVLFRHRIVEWATASLIGRRRRLSLCLWGTRAAALANADPDERVVKLAVYVDEVEGE